MNGSNKLQNDYYLIQDNKACFFEMLTGQLSYIAQIFVGTLYYMQIVL